MDKSLYLECFSGISGDMTVAALLDLGADETVLKEALASLKISGFQIQISRVKKSGIDACDFAVILDAEHENHDHDMEYLHGEKKTSGHEHAHHTESGGEQVHHHKHRGLPEIINIIETAKISESAKKTAKRIFEIIADAEAKAHAEPVEEVHFHEVGAVDSIVDIISVAVCVDNLGITDIIVPKLCEGNGTIRCQHGWIPVPAPAVLNIVATHNIQMEITDVKGELVTPTGAAIVAALQTKKTLPKHFTVEKAGIGAGKRTYECPGILRAMLIEEKQGEENQNKDRIYKLESNIDDCCGEALGYVMERLLEAGARDVHYTPVYMKKNRPAYQLNVICKEKDISKLEQIVFEETTTIGIRRVAMERSILKRRMETVPTSLGDAKVKICELKAGVRYYPEYESVIRLCKMHHLSYQDVYTIVQNECSNEDVGKC